MKGVVHGHDGGHGDNPVWENVRDIWGVYFGT